MKRAELLQHTTCSACNRKLGQTALPLFWRVKVERFGLDAKAIRRSDALGDVIGSHAIAAVMGPDEDLAVPLLDPVTLTLCDGCAMDRQCIADLAMKS